MTISSKSKQNTPRAGKQAVIALIAMALPSVVALAAMLVSTLRRADALPVLGKAPEFALVDQDARPFRTADLTGEVSVVNFVFTRCQTSCPTMTRTMAGLQGKVAGVRDVTFVSFSVDPGHDTPARLRDFGRKHGADLRNWRFVTGATGAGVKAVAKGFATSVGDEVITEKGIMDIQHGRTFVLLDKGAHIRGFYHPDAAGMAKLEHDVRSLSNRP